MNKVLRYIAGVIVLLALGAGAAWYARGMRKQGAEVQREGEQSTTDVHAPSVASPTAKDAVQATGIAASAIDDQTKTFADAVGSATAVLDPNLTNVTEEFIAQVFKGLSDPTDIIPILDAYSTGNAAQRQIAKAFFDYMLKTYPEERLQACGHYMLGALVKKDVIREAEGGFAIDADALQEATTHLEKVTQLPSKRYWYAVAYDTLGSMYAACGRASTAQRAHYYARAREYFAKEYDAAETPAVRDAVMCELLACWPSREEMKAFYEQNKTYRFTQPECQATFHDVARVNKLEP